MNKNLTIRNSTAEFLIFTTANGQDTIEVKVEGETVWLTQKLIAKLFDVNVATINEHLKNIFKTNELEENSVIRKFLITASDGKNYNTKHYNLEVIISLGYYTPTTKDFFATVQNKMHWAIRGKTAAEIIYSEADAKKIFMGLKTWKNAPDGKVLKSDVSIAKNYLNEEHIYQLRRIVTAYLDLAENRASRGIVMNMKDWILFLDKFLALSDYPILLDNGKISALEAKLKAETEYEKYRVIQDREYLSDFDRLLLDMEIE